MLLDLYLSDDHGLDLLRETLEHAGRPDFVVITAAPRHGQRPPAMQLATVHYLVKPFRFAQLEERLITYRNLHARLARVVEAEQHEVDALYGLLRGPAPLPKGQSGPTIARIREHLHSAPRNVSPPRSRPGSASAATLPSAISPSWPARAPWSCACSAARPDRLSTATGSPPARISHSVGLLVRRIVLRPGA